MADKKIKITQTGSGIGRRKDQKKTLLGLGLKGVGKSKVLVSSPEVMGMVSKVSHLIKVEDVK